LWPSDDPFVAINSIQNLLTQPDIDVTLRDTAKSSDDIPLSITNGSFQWTDTPILKDVTIHVRKGKLTALVGAVGSGKSTVVSAFLGDVQCTKGEIRSCQNLGLVAQTAWIQNMSLRDNILFGKNMNEQRYKSVLSACALLPDIASFDGGDNVEIGERGIGLSGGQKQRVALARAVYADTDVMILDDPLSAVDANVGEHLFSKCFTGPLMSQKTRFLVTNQVLLSLPIIINITR
jgi:ABC-type transport system involved in cytochrome bd biosynthesis fused ATPase/permease subunit